MLSCVPPGLCLVLVGFPSSSGCATLPPMKDREFRNWRDPGLLRWVGSVPLAFDFCHSVVSFFLFHAFKKKKSLAQSERGSLFSCTVTRSVASSLLELLGTQGADGLCPASLEVERDFRHAGLDP